MTVDGCVGLLFTSLHSSPNSL